MSTKIYNGYRLPLLSMQELLKFCKEVQTIFVEERRQMLLKLCNDNHKEWPKIHSALTRQIQDIQHTGIRNPGVDFEATAVFFPMADCILCITFWEKQEYTKIWENHDLVTYWGYWNNSDPEEGVSEEEWNLRDKQWEKALPGPGIPSKNGFSFTFARSILPWSLRS